MLSTIRHTPVIHHTAVIVLTLILNACGGGGGDGAAALDKSGVEPQAASLADAGIASVENESEHYVLVRSVSPMSAPPSPGDFAISDEEGSPVNVVDVMLSEDSTEARLVVSPGSKPGSNYTVTYADLPGESFSYAGNPIEEPRLDSVVTLSPTQLLLSFSAALSVESATEITNYYVYPAEDGAPVPGAEPLDVTGAVLLEDGSSVLLDTQTQQNIQYIVIVGPVTDDRDIYINPEYDASTITGMGVVDTGAPSIVTAARPGPTLIEVNFSEPVCRTGGNPAQYTVTYCLPAAGAANCGADPVYYDVFVNGVELNQYCTQAILSTSQVPEQANVQVTVNNVIDNAGNIFTGAVDVPAESSDQAQDDAPKLATATALDNHTVLLRFDSPMAAATANRPDFYRVIASRDGRPDIALGELEVTAAGLQPDELSVLLTTDVQNAEEYYVKASNLTNKPGDTYIDPLFNSAIFFGISAVDTTPPGVTGVSKASQSEFYVDFSEPVCGSGDDARHYQLSYCLAEAGETSCAPGADIVDLAVREAELNEYCTRVRLTTAESPDNAVLTLVVSDVTDTAGNTVLPNSSRVDAADYTPPVVLPDEPRVVGAISTSNTTVKIAFSNVMGDSAIDHTNYSIVQVNVNGEAGALAVTGAAFASDSHTSVELTTLSQNDVTYRISAVGVTDEFGQAFASIGGNFGFSSANVAEFAGTPPGGGSVIDSDGDGLADNEEQRGWLVTVTDRNGSQSQREVTSDPYSPDTDGDGLSDNAERNLNTDPRNRDTDSDELADAHEYNGIFSSPTDQDSDDDGLSDGEEVNFYRSSPLLDDTDGDQIGDDEEVVLANRNPRLADLPKPAFEVQGLSLELDVRFDEYSGSELVNSTSENVSSSLTQNSSKTRSRGSETASRIANELSVQAGFEIKPVHLGDTTLTSTVSFTHSWENSYQSSWSEESVKATQQEYGKSLESGRQFSENTSVSRSVERAKIDTLVSLFADSDVAFTVSNLTLTALAPDIRRPGEYVPVATLVAQDPEGSLSSSFNLGPLVDKIGPLIFTSGDSGAYPGQVERLMEDPTGLIFKISNYDITDESGRNFAFSSQQVNDRTTGIAIDYGGYPATEYLRVSSTFGRPIVAVENDMLSTIYPTTDAVRAAYGLGAADDDALVMFDLQGAALGVSLRDAMEQVLGLQHMDYAENPQGEARFNSYATQVLAGGSEVLTRIGDVENDPAKFAGWFLAGPQGVSLQADLPAVIKPGEGYVLAYGVDEDDDNIPLRLENARGCADAAVAGKVDDPTDTDGDGVLDDFFEEFGPRTDADGNRQAGEPAAWIIRVVDRTPYTGYSSCWSLDTDGDGLSDVEEYNGGINSTDAKKRDTDDDGISDFDEIRGYTAYLYDDSTLAGQEVGGDCEPFAGDPADLDPRYTGYTAVTCTTDPLDDDSDGDHLGDGDELRFFTNPAVGDVDTLGDADADGLLGFEENRGWNVTYEDGWTICHIFPDKPASSGCPPGTPRSTSDPYNPNSDDDGLDDFQEREAGTHPRLGDTDGDTIKDGKELSGESHPLFGKTDELGQVIDTRSNPLNTDSDHDGIGDGDEYSKWTVTVPPGDFGVPYDVWPVPGEADHDRDNLSDKQERDSIPPTDPLKANTDDDDFGFTDSFELLMGLVPTQPKDICVKFWIQDVSGNGWADMDLTILGPEDNTLDYERFEDVSNKTKDRVIHYARLTGGNVERLKFNVDTVSRTGGSDTDDNANGTTWVYSFEDFSPDDLGISVYESHRWTGLTYPVDIRWRLLVYSAEIYDSGSPELYCQGAPMTISTR